LPLVRQALFYHSPIHGDRPTSKEEEGKMNKFNTKLGLLTGVAAAVLLSGIANGQTWNEDGDAPDSLPGQLTQGSGPLTLINGVTDANSDVDIYQITITDAGSFSATTEGLTTIDTQLFLFDSDGNGVVHCDDSVGGSTLQSTLTSQFIPGPGTYYLAVTTYNNDPDSGSGLIWLNSPFRSERQPDGPGAPGPLAFWTPASGDTGTYGVALTGAGFGNGGGYFLSISGQCPGTVTVHWDGATPDRQQAIVFAANTGNFVIPNGPCQGTPLGLGTQSLRLVNTIGTGSGSGSVNGSAGTGACGGFLQLVELPSCATSNVAQLP
jgi:hypothetical protein